GGAGGRRTVQRDGPPPSPRDRPPRAHRPRPRARRTTTESRRARRTDRLSVAPALPRSPRPGLRVATAARPRRRRARSGLRRLGRAPPTPALGAGHARGCRAGRSRPARARRPPAVRRAARVTPCKVVLYNPRAVFYTMPLALVAVASALDRRRYTPVIVDGRLEVDPVRRLVAEGEDAPPPRAPAPPPAPPRRP